MVLNKRKDSTKYIWIKIKLDSANKNTYLKSGLYFGFQKVCWVTNKTIRIKILKIVLKKVCWVNAYSYISL